MAVLVLKILSKVNSEQRRYFIDVIRNFLKGKETNFGNSFSIMSFNDYAYNIPLSESGLLEAEVTFPQLDFILEK